MHRGARIGAAVRASVTTVVQRAAIVRFAVVRAAVNARLRSSVSAVEVSPQGSRYPLKGEGSDPPMDR